jgi:hypothetical protein
MTRENDGARVARFETALNQLIERIAEDRYVLAIVLVGSLSTETIWRRESLGLWIIEADGVTRRLLSDGTDERIFRTLVENGINIHAEVIPRSRFKKMVEGASRTAFSCNFFAERRIVYSKDPSIDSWFKKANSVATKDQERELLTFSTWTIHAHRQARKRLDIKGDLVLAAQETLEAAHSVAHTEIIRQGKVVEQDVIYRAIEGNPALFQEQESARAVDCPRRDRRISREALSSPPETAARLSQEAEPIGSIVGNQRTLRVFPVAPVASGIGLRVAGAEGRVAKTLCPVQVDEAKPGAGRRAGLFPRRLTCERRFKFTARGKTICKTSTWRFRATSWSSLPA